MRGRLRLIRRYRDIEIKERRFVNRRFSWSAVCKPPLLGFELPRFLYRLRQQLNARDVVPTADESSLSVENENGEFRRKRIDPELHHRFPVEIGDHKNVIARIPVNVPLGVHLLDVFGFDIEPMPNDRANYSAQRRQDVLLEIYQGNQPAFRIAQRYLGDAISNRLRLPFIAGVNDSDNRDVPVRCGNLMPVDIRKGERVTCPGTELDRLGDRRRHEQNQEKILRATKHRA
jgi:hypothetical protein